MTGRFQPYLLLFLITSGSVFASPGLASDRHLMAGEGERGGEQARIDAESGKFEGVFEVSPTVNSKQPEINQQPGKLSPIKKGKNLVLVPEALNGTELLPSSVISHQSSVEGTDLARSIPPSPTEAPSPQLRITNYELRITPQLSQIPLPVIPEEPPPTFDRNNPPPTFDFSNPPPPDTFGPQSPVPPTSPTPRPFQFDYNGEFSIYRLGIGDNITMQVAGFPEFNAQGTINIEGNFVVPILGDVPAIGLTLEQLSARVGSLLGQQYLFETPNVTSVLAGARPSTITVLGEVDRPGFYNLVPGAEVDEAIVAAGGSTDWADLRSVIVRRELTNGEILERQVNVFEALQNGTRLPILRLQDGDAVFVPKVEVGRIEDYDRALVSRSTVAQPQIAVNVLSYANEAIGRLVLANGSTFVDAIAQLNLNFDNADLDSIGLLRFDPEQGRVVSQSLDAIAAIEGDISQNVPLQDGDIFIVRRSTFAKIDYVLRTITRPINSVTGLFDFIRNTLIDTIPNLFRGRGPGFNNNNP